MSTEHRGFDSGRGIIRATTLGKLFTPNVPLFTKQYNLVPCEGLDAKAPYCFSGIGSNEQGEYCSGSEAILLNCKHPRYKSSTLLYFYFTLWLQICKTVMLATVTLLFMAVKEF